MSDLCICDIPNGVTLRIVSPQKEIFEGKVVRNYGSSIYLKLSAEQIVGVAREHIAALAIIGKESVDAFEIAAGKRDATFKQMVAQITGAAEPMPPAPEAKPEGGSPQ